MCIGDCDDDDQCAGTLQCFHDDGIEHVPGCTGKRERWRDVAVDIGAGARGESECCNICHSHFLGEVQVHDHHVAYHSHVPFVETTRTVREKDAGETKSRTKVVRDV